MLAGHKLWHLALRNDYDRDLVLPVMRTGPEAMSAWPVAAIPAVTPETSVESDLLAQAIWHLDFQPFRTSMPAGRGLRWDTLQDSEAAWPERVRSGRDGLSVA